MNFFKKAIGDDEILDKSSTLKRIALSSFFVEINVANENGMFSAGRFCP